MLKYLRLKNKIKIKIFEFRFYLNLTHLNSTLLLNLKSNTLCLLQTIRKKNLINFVILKINLSKVKANF